MQTQNILLPTKHFVLNIQQLLVTYPPSNIGLPFPYTLEDIISRCIKFASNPKDPQTEAGINEISVNISTFDQSLNHELLTHIRYFVQYLVQMFTRFGWYGSDGTSPLRFVGFTEGSYDLEVRGG